MSLYYHLPSFKIIAVKLQRPEQHRQEEEEEEQKNPVSYAFKYLNSPETQRQYPKRLQLIFNHIGLTTAGE
jgi:hypothetical protein